MDMHLGVAPPSSEAALCYSHGCDRGPSQVVTSANCPVATHTAPEPLHRPASVSSLPSFCCLGGFMLVHGGQGPCGTYSLPPASKTGVNTS